MTPILIKGMWVLDGDTHISRWAVQAGRLDHDHSLLPIILEYISEGDAVIDVGAFIGDHTVAYADKVKESGIVHAFEPNPDAFTCLRLNCQNLKQVQCHCMALGRDSAEPLRFVHHSNSGAAYLVYDNVGGPNSISCRTLDSYCFDRCDLIKIDAEGFELEILLGAAATIAQYQPVLIIEQNDGSLRRRGTSAVALRQYLQSLDYRFENVYSHLQDLDVPMLDLLCRPRRG